MTDKNQTLAEFAAERNAAKRLFTAGPASLLAENLSGLRPCFGRGDADYARVEEQVLGALKALSGHRQIARLQGSASLALEIMALNFLQGRVLTVSTGYYSDRLKWLAESAQRRTGAVREVVAVDWRELAGATGRFDWVLACYVETSCGLKIPIEDLDALAKRVGARLMLDATASIGLEPGHERADAIAYSSCKGLFGLTGAAFVAYNELPAVAVDSFYLKLDTHQQRLMTGPYHAICSLADVMPAHADFRAAVAENKRAFCRRLAAHLTQPAERQPLLCTHVDCEIASRDPRAVLYKPRSALAGSVVCHLGEAHLGRAARGAILDSLETPPAGAAAPPEVRR